MECIRCGENPATVTCSCLRFGHNVNTVFENPAVGSKTVMTSEFSEGVETVGLCERCLKHIGLREPKIRFPKLYTRFYLIWGVLAILCFAGLIFYACGRSQLSQAVGPVFFVGMIALLPAAGLFEAIARLCAANKRSDLDKRMIARVKNHPYKGHYQKTYVPLERSLYPDYATFAKVNSDLMGDNAKKVWERIVTPGSKVSFGDELKGAL